MNIAILLLWRDGRILAQRRRADAAHLPGVWEFPGGKVEAGETPHAAAIREAREELGVEIEIIGERTEIIHEYSQQRVTIFPFDARITSGQVQPLESDELRWLLPRELNAEDFPPANRTLIEEIKHSTARCNALQVAAMFNAPQGLNFSSKMLSAPELAWALCRTASFIQEIEPHGTQLQKYDDWWEHDGSHFHKGAISIHELFEMVKSPQSLNAAMQGDENVFIGVAPDSQLWYLRFYLTWNDEGFELNGRFDITLPAGMAPSFKQRMLGLSDLKEQDAATYYNSIGL